MDPTTQRNVAAAFFVGCVMLYIALFTISYSNMTWSVISTMVMLHIMIESGSLLYRTQQRINIKKAQQTNTIQSPVGPIQIQIEQSRPISHQAAQSLGNFNSNTMVNQTSQAVQAAQAMAAQSLGNFNPNTMVNQASQAAQAMATQKLGNLMHIKI